VGKARKGRSDASAATGLPREAKGGLISLARNTGETAAATAGSMLHPMTVQQLVPALEIKGLKKSFGRPAVDGLDLKVRPGEFYMLLGPNGAGKTTTLRMVSGLLTPDSGDISIFGIDAIREPLAAKRIVGWLSDEPMIYDKLTPLEYLEFVAGLWTVNPTTAKERAHDLLHWIGLKEHAHERCEKFSRGMRQKVALAGALLHEPKLIILDEPLTGLDAGAARVVKDVLMDNVREGRTVIMTTHILEIAERMADRIGVISKGRLIAEGTLDELRERFGTAGATLEDVFLALVE
jgi:ABC-2 type transport system ATP-binding protein